MNHSFFSFILKDNFKIEFYWVHWIEFFCLILLLRLFFLFFCSTEFETFFFVVYFLQPRPNVTENFAFVCLNQLLSVRSCVFTRQSATSFKSFCGCIRVFSLYLCLRVISTHTKDHSNAVNDAQQFLHVISNIQIENVSISMQTANKWCFLRPKFRLETKKIEVRQICLLFKPI